MLPLRLLRRAINGVASNNLYRNTNLKRLKPTTSVIIQKYYSSKYIVDSPFSSVTVPDLTIEQYIFQNLEKWPEKTAMVCGVSGRKYTYSQLRMYSKKVALGLLKAGVKPGQIITLVLPNIPEFLIAVLGAMEAGIVISTVNPLYSAEEIKHQLVDSGSACVITFQQKVNDVNEAISKIPNNKLLPTIVINSSPSDGLPPGCREFRHFLEMQNPDDTLLKGIKRNPDEMAVLLYSSGTTGLPKGVISTHRQIISNCAQMSHPSIRIVYDTTDSHQDVIMCVLPFFHCYGLAVTALANLSQGTKLLTLPKFEPQSFINTLKECSIAYLVPPIIQFLGNQPVVTSKHLDKLRTICNGAAAISASDGQKLLDKKQLNISSGYGMTEASPVITASGNTGVDLYTVGRPLSNTSLKIVNTETGELMDPSKPGEICVKGPQLMVGYFNNEKATAETLKDGWLHTGDVGYIDNEGRLLIVDRLKELIKVKGFQVAPLELEEVLRQHPEIGDVAVVGKADSRYGEVPVAFVVPKTDKKLNEKDIIDFVASKVAEYKQINSVIFTTSIPKNTTGKILRKTLRESLK